MGGMEWRGWEGADERDRFLADVKQAGSLSPAQRIKSNVIPLVTGMSFLSAFSTPTRVRGSLTDLCSGLFGDERHREEDEVQEAWRGGRSGGSLEPRRCLWHVCGVC